MDEFMPLFLIFMLLMYAFYGLMWLLRKFAGGAQFILKLMWRLLFRW